MPGCRTCVNPPSLADLADPSPTATATHFHPPAQNLLSVMRVVSSKIDKMDRNVCALAELPEQLHEGFKSLAKDVHKVRQEQGCV